MDFNSLLRRHTHGEEQRGFRVPFDEDLYAPTNVEYPYDMADADWEDVPQSNFQSGGIPPEGYISGEPDSRMDHIWSTRGGSADRSHHGTQSPPLAIGPSTQALTNEPRRSSPALLHTHRDAIFQSTWLRNNEEEPPMQPDDPLVRLGLLTRDSSRFDLFIHSTGERHNCLYVQPGSTETCPYSNFRRQRVKVHVLAHFSYKPFVCDGSCGKADCNLGFADNALLGDHVRRVARPRAQCEICGAMIAPQNYRRHQGLMHGGN